VLQELSTFCGSTLPRLLVPIFLTALLPLPETMYTGNGGEPMLAILAPLLLVVSSGLVFVGYWVLLLLIWPLKRVSMIISRRYEILSISEETCIKSALMQETRRGSRSRSRNCCFHATHSCPRVSCHSMASGFLGMLVHPALYGRQLGNENPRRRPVLFTAKGRVHREQET